MNKKTIRGFTLAEMVISVMIMSLVVLFGTGALVTTLKVWNRGQVRIGAEVETSAALRRVRDNLKEAMEVTIDPDGNGINFKLPAKDANGNYITPLTYDGISRRFALSSGNLTLTVNGNSTTILTNVVTKDHRGDGSSPTYQIFTPGTGSIIRIVTVQLVTDRVIQNGQHAYGRVREQILLRNTPQIIQ